MDVIHIVTLIRIILQLLHNTVLSVIEIKSANTYFSIIKVALLDFIKCIYLLLQAYDICFDLL